MRRNFCPVVLGRKRADRGVGEIRLTVRFPTRFIGSWSERLLRSRLTGACTGASGDLVQCCSKAGFDAMGEKLSSLSGAEYRSTIRSLFGRLGPMNRNKIGIITSMAAMRSGRPCRADVPQIEVV